MDPVSIAILAFAVTGTAAGIWWYVHARERQRSNDLRNHSKAGTNQVGNVLQFAPKQPPAKPGPKT